MEVEYLELTSADTTEIAIGLAKAFPNLRSLRVRGFQGTIPKELAARVVSLDCELGTVKYDYQDYPALRELTIHNTVACLEMARIPEYFAFQGTQLQKLRIQGKRVVGEAPWLLNILGLRTLEVRAGWGVSDAHALCRIMRSIDHIERTSVWIFHLSRDVSDIKFSVPVRGLACSIESPTPNGGWRGSIIFNTREVGYGPIESRRTGMLLGMLKYASDHKDTIARIEVTLPKSLGPDAHAHATTIPAPLPRDYSPRVMNLMLREICQGSPQLHDLVLYVVDTTHLLETLEAFTLVREIRSLAVIVYTSRWDDPMIGTVRDQIRAVLSTIAVDMSWSDGVDYFLMTRLLSQ
jgi:hypothetical protein